MNLNGYHRVMTLIEEVLLSDYAIIMLLSRSTQHIPKTLVGYGGGPHRDSKVSNAKNLNVTLI